MRDVEIHICIGEHRARARARARARCCQCRAALDAADLEAEELPLREAWLRIIDDEVAERDVRRVGNVHTRAAFKKQLCRRGGAKEEGDRCV